MARLRSLRMRGFKTFARPTELVFEPGVTVIIGPNGSGKSNIADAILWVLGEQSPLSLRGRSMQDVIFSGNGGQRSSAVAEVSLVFEDLPEAFPLGGSELEITRRLARDGSSEYRLNGHACRLMDVQDVIGGLGLGREMHSVVSQGRVEEFLSYTAEARRAMVEEAAGVGRLKKRRERALSKMERTLQNLQRVADVEREVKAALRPLKQQVAAAERFASVMEEWAEARARYTLHSLLAVQTELAAVEEEMAAAESRRQEIAECLAESRRRRSEAEEEFTAALAQRDRMLAWWHRLSAVAEHLAGRSVALRQRLVRLESESERAARRLELAQSEFLALSEQAAALQGGSPDETRLSRVTLWAERLAQEHAEVAAAYGDLLQREEELKDAVFEAETARSRALQDRELLRRQCEEKKRLQKELESMIQKASSRLEALGEERRSMQEQLLATQREVEAVQEQLAAALAEREAARVRAEEAAVLSAGLEETLAGLERRKAVLEDLLARHDGLLPGARQVVDLGGGRPLTEVLSVEAGYERAVAAALGPVAQAVVIGGSQSLGVALAGEGAVEAIRPISGGSGEPLMRSHRSAQEDELPPGTRCLWDVVSGPSEVIAALQRILPPAVIAIDPEKSLAEWADRPRSGWRIVSRDGEIVQGGVYAARRQELAAETVLKARNELELTLRELTDTIAQRDAAHKMALEASQAAAEADKRWKECEQRLRLVEGKLAAARNEEELVGRRIEEAQLQTEETRQRLQREVELSRTMEGDLIGVERLIAEKEAQVDQARAFLRELQAKLEAARSRVTRYETKKAQAGLVEVRLRERLRGLQAEKERVLAQQARAQAEARRCARRVTWLQEYLPLVSKLLENAEKLARSAQSSAGSLESEVETARLRSEAAARLVQDQGGTEAQWRKEAEELTARASDLRVRKALLEERKALLEQELAELRRKHLSPRGVKPEDVRGADPAALAEAVSGAQRRLDRMGPVNPLAEQECAAMEERAQSLAEQRADLESSLAQLREVVDELDEHIERTFAEVFAATREHFVSVVASVFPGARGTLKLSPSRPRTRSEGEVETAVESLVKEESDQGLGGIDIEVRLPNKAPRSLSLLSGGEKAMTAIAFLFSLFLARPCPFYILDEVEASLDDINIRRFLSLVSKYKDKTQFVIITHQRQTMEIADTLYGVTLERDGTSRVLSRRLRVGKGA